MGGTAAFEGEALGSPLRLLLRAPRHVAARAWDAVRDEMAAADRDLSSHRHDSALAALNAASASAATRTVPRRLRIALGVAWRAHRSTGGLFDPRLSRRRTPAAKPAGGGWLRRCGAAVAVTEPLDLGGIGKGLALRWASDRLARLGVADFLLVAGGDLVARGSVGSSEWRIALAGLDLRAPVGVLALPDRGRPVAVATSAITRHPDHIVDPRTEAHVDGPLVQVTVAGSDPAWAEVASKVALIRGRVAADGPAWWLSRDGRVGVSPSGHEWVRWLRAGQLGA